jgi:hypothetical protein
MTLRKARLSFSCSWWDKCGDEACSTFDSTGVNLDSSAVPFVAIMVSGRKAAVLGIGILSAGGPSRGKKLLRLAERCCKEAGWSDDIPGWDGMLRLGRGGGGDAVEPGDVLEVSRECGRDLVVVEVSLAA